MIVRTGTILFASDDSDEARTDGQEYLRRFKLTQDDVKFIKRDGQTIIEAKREFELGRT